MYKTANSSTHGQLKQARGIPLYKEPPYAAAAKKGQETYNKMIEVNGQSGIGRGAGEGWSMIHFDVDRFPVKEMLDRWKVIVHAREDEKGENHNEQSQGQYQINMVQNYVSGLVPYIYQYLYDVPAGTIAGRRYDLDEDDRYKSIRDHWPDVILSTWKEQCGEYARRHHLSEDDMIGGVKYVLQSQIRDQDTVKLMNEFLGITPGTNEERSRTYTPRSDQFFGMPPSPPSARDVC